MAPPKSKNASKSKPAPFNSTNKLKQGALGQTPKETAKNKFEAQLKKLQAENAALRAAASSKENTGTSLIPRPAGGHGRKGFKLQAAMQLEDNAELYMTLRRVVRDAVARAGIDYNIPWPRQPVDVVAKVVALARGRNEYFSRFAHGWPIEEFVKVSLKNRRAYARKRGFASRGGAGGSDNENEDEHDVGGVGEDGPEDGSEKEGGENMEGDDDE